MSIEAMKQAYEVPLVEQLESVPNNARLVIDDADGMGTRYIPVGRMCHDASKALRQAIAEAEKKHLGLTAEILLYAAQSSLSPNQYEHFEAMSEYQPEIYDRLAKAINSKLKEQM